MYCDYNALAEYAKTLSKNFNNISAAIFNFEASMKTITNLNNWNSQTRDYVLDLYNSLQDNFEIMTNKFNNINQYVDTVISNYKATEQQMGSVFGG